MLFDLLFKKLLLVSRIFGTQICVSWLLVAHHSGICTKVRISTRLSVCLLRRRARWCDSLSLSLSLSLSFAHQ